MNSTEKKVLVWTVNLKAMQRHFLCSQVDAIITDNISQALQLQEKLKERSDLMRIIDAIRMLLG